MLFTNGFSERETWRYYQLYTLRSLTSTVDSMPNVNANPNLDVHTDSRTDRQTDRWAGGHGYNDSAVDAAEEYM